MKQVRVLQIALGLISVTMAAGVLAADAKNKVKQEKPKHEKAAVAQDQKADTTEFDVGTDDDGGDAKHRGPKVKGADEIPYPELDKMENYPAKEQ
jgi:hypothetical protein